MKFTVEQAPLLAALTHILGAVERRSIIPILANVVLVATKGSLALKGTDMDMEIVEQIAAAVSVMGTATVGAYDLQGFVKGLGKGALVEIELGATSLAVRSGGASRSFPTLPVEDYPVLFGKPSAHSFTLPAPTLCKMLENVAFAISTEKTRRYLNGVYLHVGENKLRAVATDGHRLARVEVPLPEGAQDLQGVIVPRKVALAALKFLKKSREDVTVELGAGFVKLTCGDLALHSKLIDGTFPAYQRGIPIGNDKILVVDSFDLASCVARVEKVNTSRDRPVRLTLEGGALTISAKSPGGGVSSEVLAVSYKGNPLDIGLNAKYLAEMLKLVGGDVRAAFDDASSPALFTSVLDPSLLFVHMPLRV